jgi:hypothetical protein
LKNKKSNTLENKEKMEGELMTFKGLQKWYSGEFKKAGWVVLAVTKGHHHKALWYRHSLVHLLRSIETKMKTVVGQDERSELQIMYANTQILLDYVNRTFAEAIQRAMAERDVREVVEVRTVSGQSPRAQSVMQQFTAPLTQAFGM